MINSMAGNFERARRIVKTDEFSSVFRLRPAFKTGHLVFYVRPNALLHARLGVVVAKRLASRAVTRNAVKRAVREGFRQSELLRSLGLDCVVRLSKPLGSKQEPACTAALQALLFREVASVFSDPSKLKKIVEGVCTPAVHENTESIKSPEGAKGLVE